MLNTSGPSFVLQLCPHRAYRESANRRQYHNASNTILQHHFALIAHKKMAQDYMNLMRIKTHTYTHTHPFNGPFPGPPKCAGTRKVKPIWNFLKQETVRGSGISWVICMSAPCSRQTTTPAPHHFVFTGQMPFLPPNQQRQSTEGNLSRIQNSIIISHS